MQEIFIPNEIILSEGVEGIAMTSEQFSDEIERRVSEHLVDGYIEAITDYINELDQDPEDMKHLISPTLIGKLEAEAYRRGFLKDKQNTINLMEMFE